jgi:hypothetical protein
MTITPEFDFEVKNTFEKIKFIFNCEFDSIEINESNLHEETRENL